MTCHFVIKRLCFLFFTYLMVLPLMAKPTVWQGVPMNEEEPSLSGQLKVYITDGRARGEIAGSSASAVIDSDKRFMLFFTAGSQQGQGVKPGTFTGYLSQDGELRGHWVQYGMQKRASTPYASPVHFVQEGDVYVGNVAPLADKLSIFFITEPKAKGRYTFTIFIPENNVGRFYNNAELILADGQATWVSVSEDGEEVVATGTYDAEADTFNLQLPYWGGDVRFTRQPQDVNELVAATRQNAYRVPINENDGWPVGHADTLGIDSKVLEDFANTLRSEPVKTPYEAQTEALLIAKNGVLVFEQYFRGHDSKTPHDLRSASKSLTGILPGLAEQAGLTDKTTSLLNSGVYKSLGISTKDRRKQAITLEHALSMSTGLDCDDNQQNSPGNEDTMQNQQEEPDWFNYILQLDAIHQPGHHLAYCSGGINLAGPVLTAMTDRWVPALIEDLFARPLGIKQYHINLLPDGQQAYSGGGLHLRARDFLKMGQVMLNNGRWGDRQLLSPDYVKNALTPRGTLFGDGYGLGWWLRTYTVDGRDYRAFYAGGNGGQQIMAVPELELVVVSLGSAYGTRGTFKMRDDWFPNIILKQAVKKGGDK